MAQRRGKIAKLPQAIREELNQRLVDGQQGPQILPWLNGLPEVKAMLQEDFEGLCINDGNLSEWRKGGYAEWLRRREKVERTRELADYSMRLARASGGNLSEGAATILGGQIMDVLEGVDELRQLTSELEGVEPAKRGEQIALMLEMLNTLSLSLARVRKGDQTAQQLQQNEKRLAQNQEALDLDNKRFMRQTCELFIKWEQDRRAKDISSSNVPNAQKIEALGQLMFGEDWEAKKGSTTDSTDKHG